MNSSAPFDSQRAIDHLRRQVRILTCVVAVMSSGLVVLTLAAFRQSSPAIIRARGIIIEDQVGRERILIGAPIPFAKNRVRTDTARVAQLWAGRFPDRAQYMGYYKGYRHSMDGLLVLDENGIDRVALGDSVPDPNIGKRIGPSTGVVINDQEGFERSGYGLLNVNGQYRVVLGLDSKRGTEGLALALRDDGAVGLSVYGSNRSVAFLGNAPANDPSTGVADSVFGFVLRQAAK
ncbi:MAG: hypothetical protein AUG74_06890 [Bacteroidetes bacterium 13_1_20CM_4_60_6]|nr:MAG: hypothetical protein AUG74_06890 [Bacteroidetes bacterium 13_1_20CM_4_60_6]